ncbi:MAG: hypothetical protein A3D13_04950 [Planctomycetes bacterium RIFCSPHIGHO2_02_FULL_40_12]|nr:MAG: hypothetical protein A3D13_04950 [Planctomycetes bacterium RIFCSPHIGHO2_02_FULL_40_12]
MKGFWIIVILIMVLVPLFMLSRENDKEKAEKTKEEVIIDEEPVIMEVPDIVENILYESASKFRMHMKSLEEYDDALAVSIESQNWDDISKYAMLLKNTSPLIFTDKRKVELPKEFIMLDTFFHFQSLAVVEASKSREMVRLNIEYEKLQQTCNDCHEKYKKKE